MRLRILTSALLIAVLLLLAVACAAAQVAPGPGRPQLAVPEAPISGQSQTLDRLPPTSTPAPRGAPTPTPVGGSTNVNFFDLNLSQSDEEGLLGRADELYQKLINSGGEVDRSVLIDAYKQLADYAPVGGHWRPIGPSPIDAVNLPQGPVPGSGRVNGLAIDPRNGNVAFAATAAGGMWKTEDGGQSWKSLSDKQVPVIYGGVLIDPDHPDTVYGLLQDFDGQEASQYGYLANGIMRSTDGGNNWKLLGQDVFVGGAVTSLVFGKDGTLYASSGQIGLFQVPPNQADFGVFKSTNGGNSWQRLISCGKTCQPTAQSSSKALLGGFEDLKMGTDGTLYASLCNRSCFGMHLLRSTDGGANWKELDFSNVLADFQARKRVNLLYLDNAQKIPALNALKLSVSPTDPKVILAGGGIYLDTPGSDQPKPWSYAMRSTDGGDTWEWLSGVLDYCTNSGHAFQCTYDNIVEIDPRSSNVMYLGGSLSDERKTYYWVKVLQRSQDGGKTWTDMTPGKSKQSFVHPDAHVLAFDPSDTNVLWLGTDGGAYKSPDGRASPPTWIPVNQGMNTLLFVGIALHPTDPNYVLGGLQDNGNAYTTDGGKTWHGASQGDGGFCVVDPFKPNIVYSEYAQGVPTRNDKGGKGGGRDWFGSDFAGYTNGLSPDDTWAFYAPLIADPSTEGVLYFASNRIYRTANRGDLWKPISPSLTASARDWVQSMAVASSDPKTLYAGTTDSRIWVTTDGGKNWSNITPRSLPKRTVWRMAVDPADAKTAYALVGGFNIQTPDTPGHVFRTTDGGRNWEDISKNLPDAPLQAITLDIRPKYSGVYVGGALGVWVLQKGSDKWAPYGTGMPFSLVADLQLNPKTGVMAAGTFGRSVWMIDMP